MNIASLIRLLHFILSQPLNQDAKLAAVFRFLRWQLASRLIKRPISLPFVNDTVLLAQSGMTGATLNWYNGLHEPVEMAFALHMLRPGDLFVDVGSNVGSYTILAGGAAKADVISIEPIPSTFQSLQRNIWLNNLRQTESYCCGLSSKQGELSFISTLDTTNRVATPEDAQPTITVPVTTLDALLDGRKPTLVKIDVEGHELAVLDGGTRTLSSPEVRAVILETNGSGERFGVENEKLFNRMDQLGLRLLNMIPTSEA